jgi:hypothetical protein
MNDLRRKSNAYLDWKLEMEELGVKLLFEPVGKHQQLVHQKNSIT